MKLSAGAKTLFQAIHQEYESQGTSIRGENSYTGALRKLQKRIYKGEDTEQIQADFEHLKNSDEHR
ncbi:MAG: hypothetical protein HQM13_21180 [SAR324 cluster bacterium]|nr:hypothetical protein [SAR324 cluster bacterium]